MQIKAQGLLNAAEWIEEQYGQASLRDVIRACGPEVRDRYTSAIAINWHPMAEFVEFLEVADRLLGRGDGRIAEEIGAAGARKNMKGAMLRLAFYLSKPDFLMKRITQLWRQFNDEGSMELLHIDEFSSSIEVKGVTRPQWLFCCTLTGWSREVSNALGGQHPVVKHTDCRARGQSRCIWQLKWTGLARSAMVTKNAVPSVFPPGPPSSMNIERDSSTTRSSARISTTTRATEPRIAIDPKSSGSMPKGDPKPPSSTPQVPSTKTKKP